MTATLTSRPRHPKCSRRTAIPTNGRKSNGTLFNTITQGIVHVDLSFYIYLRLRNQKINYISKIVSLSMNLLHKNLQGQQEPISQNPPLKVNASQSQTQRGIIQPQIPYSSCTQEKPTIEVKWSYSSPRSQNNQHHLHIENKSISPQVDDRGWTDFANTVRQQKSKADEKAYSSFQGKKASETMYKHSYQVPPERLDCDEILQSIWQTENVIKCGKYQVEHITKGDSSHIQEKSFKKSSRDSLNSSFVLSAEQLKSSEKNALEKVELVESKRYSYKAENESKANRQPSSLSSNIQDERFSNINSYTLEQPFRNTASFDSIRQNLSDEQENLLESSHHAKKYHIALSHEPSQAVQKIKKQEFLVSEEHPSFELKKLSLDTFHPEPDGGLESNSKYHVHFSTPQHNQNAYHSNYQYGYATAYPEKSSSPFNKTFEIFSNRSNGSPSSQNVHFPKGEEDRPILEGIKYFKKKVKGIFPTSSANASPKHAAAFQKDRKYKGDLRSQLESIKENKSALKKTFDSGHKTQTEKRKVKKNEMNYLNKSSPRSPRNCCSPLNKFNILIEDPQEGKTNSPYPSPKNQNVKRNNIWRNTLKVEINGVVPPGKEYQNTRGRSPLEHKNLKNKGQFAKKAGVYQSNYNKSRKNNSNCQSSKSKTYKGNNPHAQYSSLHSPSGNKVAGFDSSTEKPNTPKASGRSQSSKKGGISLLSKSKRQSQNQLINQVEKVAQGASNKLESPIAQFKEEVQKQKESKKTLAERINEQLNRIERLNQMDTESIFQRNSPQKTKQSNQTLQRFQRKPPEDSSQNARSLHINRINSLTVRPSSLENYEPQLSTVNQQSRRLEFEKIISRSLDNSFESVDRSNQRLSAKNTESKHKNKIFSTSRKSTTKKNPNRSFRLNSSKKRIEKIYEQEVKFHNQSLEKRLFGFLVEQDSKLGRPSERKNKFSPTKKQKLVRERVNSSISPSTTPKAKVRGNFVFKNPLMDKKYPQRQLFENSETPGSRNEPIKGEKTSNPKFQESEVREQIRKIKEYEFVERYMSNCELEELMQQYINASIPTRKWSLLVIDEVYKRIRAKKVE